MNLHPISEVIHWVRSGPGKGYGLLFVPMVFQAAIVAFQLVAADYVPIQFQSIAADSMSRPPHYLPVVTIVLAACIMSLNIFSQWIYAAIAYVFNAEMDFSFACRLTAIKMVPAIWLDIAIRILRSVELKRSSDVLGFGFPTAASIVVTVTVMLCVATVLWKTRTSDL